MSDNFEVKNENDEINAFSLKDLLEEIEKRDIRVIIYGEDHDDPYTIIPTPLLEALKSKLTGVYVEQVTEDGTPDPSILPEQKKGEKKNDAQKLKTETKVFRSSLLLFNGKPTEKMTKAVQFIVRRKLEHKAYVFGCPGNTPIYRGH